RTTANDTLWEIAQRVGGGSVNQAMLAIQDLNPDAFIGGNINRMKSGQVLRLPDEQQIRSRSNAEAIAQVAEQNAAWREGRAVASRQLDATRRTTAGAAPATAEAGDSLKLVAAEAGQSTRGSDTGAAGSKALADKLAVTQESLDSTRRENAELQSRVGDLQSQLDKLQRLVELKDSQLAKLQADLSAAPAAPATTEEPPAETPAVEPEAAPPAVEAATPPTTPPEEAAPDYNYSEEPAAPVEDSAAATQQPASEPAAAVEPAAPVKPAEAAKPATPAPAPAPAPQGFIDDLMANPMTLGLAGGGALLLLLVGLMALSRRNAQKESELQDELADDLSQEQAFASDLDMPEDSFAGLDDEPVQTAQAAGEERVTAQTGDALGEADIYIAYGRFNQAAELLQNAINDEPHRADLRLKLMEVYAELGDREGFARQDNELREIGGVNAEAEQLKSKYPAIAAFAGVGAAAAAASVDDDMGDFSLDDLSLDEPTAEAPASTGGDLDDAFDLSLDDLEADLESDVQSAKAEQAPLSLDDDLDFGLVDEPAAPAASADDDLGFDLALDDDKVELSQPADDLSAFSLDLDETTPAVSDEADDFLLSLDDDAPLNQPADDLSDLSLDLAEEAPSANLDLPADFDLSLEDETPVQPAVTSDSFAAQLDEVTAELDQLSTDFEEPQAAPLAPANSLSSDLDGDDDFDFLSGTDETATKLDLARAYIDMGDTEGARDILDEVIAEGSDAQQQEAREMIAKMV
ncbi:MAG: FimV/HubP family polar landmark protein, partial [Pseudomonas sp.]|nr:FimV/HubP family polar landmark protein [Pseudomonas sp.]